MRLLAVLAALAGTIVCPAVATAAPPTRVVGYSTQPVSADSRYAGFPTDTGAVHVIDTVAHTSRDLAAPPGCTFADVGGGQALWNCPAEQFGVDARLVDIATGQVHTAPEPHDGEIDASFDVVGSNWVGAQVSGNHYTSARVYVNWRTGELDYPASSPYPPTGSPGAVPDLDSPGLARTLCRPLRRSVNPAYDGGTETYGEPFLPFEYERPYGAWTRGKKLVLGRCHSHERRVFRGSASVELRSGLLTWVDGKTARGYVPRTGRTFAWRLAGADRVTIAHTATHVFITAFAGGRGTVLSARWRRQPPS